MSSPDPLLYDEDGDALAAEFALGVLDSTDQAVAERRYVSDAGFAAEADAWRGYLTGLIQGVAPEAPPSGVWTAIARRLDDPKVVELQLRRSVRTWRGVAAATGALAAGLALAVVWPHPTPAAPPVLTARLSASARGPTVFVALYDPARRAIVLTPAAVSAAADRSPELWLIPVGGKPIAVGVAAFGGSVQLIPTADGAGVRSGTLAVSIEPKGGSPTGQPTGPVIATGQLAEL